MFGSLLSTCPASNLNVGTIQIPMASSNKAAKGSAELRTLCAPPCRSYFWAHSFFRLPSRMRLRQCSAVPSLTAGSHLLTQVSGAARLISIWASRRGTVLLGCNCDPPAAMSHRARLPPPRVKKFAIRHCVPWELYVEHVAVDVARDR